MDLARYCVKAVLVEGRSVRAVAAATGRSKSWVQRHVALYRAGAEEALAPQKRGPRVPANLTSAAWEDEIVAWRKRLAEDGLDAGAPTIHLHLNQTGAAVPALSTIHRVLRRARNEMTWHIASSGLGCGYHRQYGWPLSPFPGSGSPFMDID